jgi:hypothetical protein
MLELAFNLELHVCQHLKRHTILKKKEKRFGRIHLLTVISISKDYLISLSYLFTEDLCSLICGNVETVFLV